MKFPRKSPRTASRRGLLFWGRQGRSRIRYPGLDVELVRVGRQAMASQFEFFFPPRFRAQMPVIQSAFDEIDRLEQLMTIYKDDSHLSELNRNACGATLPVDPDLFPVLELSRKIWKATHRAFDITAGPLGGIWGFAFRSGRVPAPEEIRRERERVGSEFMHLDSEALTLSFDRPLELNLGAIGKGYALDRVMEFLNRERIVPLLAHAGFSSILAKGSPNDAGAEGWPVGIRNPLEPSTDLARLRLKNQAMATSGIAEQSFRVGGRVYGHVIDPRTGYPSDRHQLVTVIAPGAALADALSTAFFVMTLEEIEAFCARNSGVGALVLARGRNGSRNQLNYVGLQDNDLEVLCEI